MALPSTSDLRKLRDNGLPANTYARVNDDLFHLAPKLLDEVIRLREALVEEHDGLQSDAQSDMFTKEYQQFARDMAETIANILGGNND